MKGADLALPFGPENVQGTRMPGKNANPSSQLHRVWPVIRRFLPLIQWTQSRNNLAGSYLGTELIWRLSMARCRVRKRLPCMWLSLSLGSKAGISWGGGGGVEQAPRCHPHPASTVSLRSGLFATMSGIPPTAALFARWLLRNWRPPMDKLGA